MNNRVIAVIGAGLVLGILLLLSGTDVSAQVENEQRRVGYEAK